MAQALENPETVSIASGVNATFATVWTFEAASEVRVLVDSIEKTQGVHYEVAAGDWLNSGGNVVFEAAHVPTAGQRVVRQRRTPLVQAEAFGDLGRFEPSKAEAAYDRLTRALQEQAKKLDRALVVEPGDNPPSAEDLRQAAILAEGKADLNLGNATTKPDVSGAVARPWVAKAIELISDTDFDDTGRSDVVALEMALERSADGEIPLRLFKARVIDQPLMIPAGATLSGPQATPDQAIGIGVEYQGQGLTLTDDVSISMDNGARIENTRLSLMGLTRPTTPSQAMAARAAMAGTAIISAGIAVDISGTQLIGFDQAILIPGVGRHRIVDNVFDCRNGIKVVQSLDVTTIERNHFFPFMTAGSEGTAGQSGYEARAITRPGFAIVVGGGGVGGADDQNDYSNIINNFSFGYQGGISLDGVSHARVAGNGCDNNPFCQIGTADDRAFAAASFGLNVQGFSRNVHVEDFRASAQGRSVIVQPQPSGRTPRVTIAGLRSWAPNTAHVHHVTGELVLETSGLETSEGGPFPDGHKIIIADTIASCRLSLNQASRPSLVASNAALTKTFVADMVTRPEPGAGLRELFDQVRDRTSVKDFGAIGDGASHPLSSITRHSLRNTTGWSLAQWQTVYPFADSLTNEIDWCATQAALNTGRHVFAPPGEYWMGVKDLRFRPVVLNDGPTLEGAGRGITVFMFAGSAANCMDFRATAGNGLHNLTIRFYAGNRPNAIYWESGNNLSSRGVSIQAYGADTFTNAFFLEGGVGGLQQFLYDIEDWQIYGGGRHFLVGDQALVQDVWIRKGIGDAASIAGIDLRHCSGVYVEDAPDLIQCQHALVTSPAAGQAVKAVDAKGLLLDTSLGHGAKIVTNGGTVGGMQLNLGARTNGTVALAPTSEAGSGVYIDQLTGKIDGILLTGDFYNNNSCGVAVVAARNVEIKAHVGYNSVRAPGQFPGVYIGPNAVDCSVHTGYSGLYGNFRAEIGLPPTQSYGILIETGALRTTVSGVNVIGNLTKGILDLGTDTRITSCQGYANTYTAPAVLEAGDTFVDLLLTPLDAPLTKEAVRIQTFGPTPLWPDSVTGQIVRVTAEGPVAGDTFFQLHVDLSV